MTNGGSSGWEEGVGVGSFLPGLGRRGGERGGTLGGVPGGRVLRGCGLLSVRVFPHPLHAADTVTSGDLEVVGERSVRLDGGCF